MPVRRINPYIIKLNRPYSLVELATRLGVHKNTVRSWQRDGLKPIDNGRPILFRGDTVRIFLIKRNASRKRPCPPGALYCFRCREPRPPANRMVEYVELKPGTGNLGAVCETCGTTMHRRARFSALTVIMPGIEVRIREAPARLSGSPLPTLNCDFRRHAPS